MIKFLLGFIAIVFLTLVIYRGIDSDNQQDKHLNVKKAEVVLPAKKITKKRSDINIPKIKKEVPSRKVQSAIKIEHKMQSATLEITKDEFATDVETMIEGESEKYDSSIDNTSDKPLDDTELDAIEKQMLERGEINNEIINNDSQNNLEYDPSELAY